MSKQSDKWPFNLPYNPTIISRQQFLDKFTATIDKWTEEQNVQWIISVENDD